MMTLLNTAVSFRRSLLLAGLMLFALAAAPGAHAQSSSDAPSPAKKAEATPDATVHVEGMACQMCARSMKNALGTLDSIEHADVDLDAQQVRLTFKPGQQATEDALRNAVEGAGYTFRKVVFAGDATPQEDASSEQR